MRINKYIAACGVASRRKAEELILNGKVKVNGEVISDSIEVTVISSSSLNDLSKTDYFIFAFVAVFIICIGIAIPFLNKAGK